ncbi:probable E3 ubiquitin-protein ligase RHC1A [Lactuca sativa]|uniref:RING-type E3 ubiquitin transferase n=1 Tax=Lactuca sativa TaxID=4236 RepID=A0A9R1VNR2_LACSA|nr:probable E3 ubiquitin-protein ligase RHC1A [Lactuca sativa]XP_023751145.1 probable E3 ubiquitin-protein ligase RHC1A [Lactuca sativa]XP_023751146.1 probable E3 ubiquitin-protein ligase RHC1A [Lactuca sativa]KAJ0207923.1 hypothetical protein LSAT_V11C500267550 [Lactuca sativa]
MSSGNNTHWCYQCQQPVRLRGRNPVCPYCSGGFVQELSEVVEPGPQDIGTGPTHSHEPSEYGFMEPYPDPRNRIMDAFAELIRQRMSGRNPNFDVRRRSEQSHGVVPWFIFDGQAPARMSANDRFEFFFNGAPPGPRRSNVSNIFMGPGLQELIEQLTVNGGGGSQGPPPATRSAIDSMPTIRISNRHLNTDSHCPVCKDKFELGSEARQMPCNHIYHSGCIEPWLVQHNSCPVCRVELPAHGMSRGSSSGGGGGGEESGGHGRGRRSPLSFLWPFRS